jgi:hypothetical protein
MYLTGIPHHKVYVEAFTWSQTAECSHSNSIAVDFVNQLAVAGIIH